MSIFRGMAAIAAVFGMVTAASADIVAFDFATDSAGTYLPGGGHAPINFEMYVTITDNNGNGFDTQGLQGWEGNLLADTGSPVMNLGGALTQDGGNYASYPTITSPLYNAMAKPGGFGMGFFTNLGTTIGDDVFGIGFFGPLEWDADANTMTGGNQPYALAGVGHGSPTTAVDSGGNPFTGFSYGGVARDRWYLISGTISVPAAAGTYTVEWQPGETNMIRGDNSPFGPVDLNSDILNGYVESATWTSTRVGGSFSFTVTPEPATMSALLLAGAGLVMRRRR